MQKSVSSGRETFPTLPKSSRKPSAASNADRRTAMLPAHTLRTRAGRSGIPEYDAPTAQPNSPGNQPGRSVAHSGYSLPPTPATSTLAKCGIRPCSQSGVASASSSRKATTAPRL